MLGLLTGCKLEASLNCELKVVRCELPGSELASGELIEFLLMDVFLHNARLGEVLYWDQSEQVCFLG